MMITPLSFLSPHLWRYTTETVPTHLSSPTTVRKHRQVTMASSNGENDQNQGKTQHGQIGHKHLLQTDALHQYILETSVYPKEHPLLKELREVTEKHPWNLMASSDDGVQLLSMIVKLIDAKNTIEIGVYTGYSLLATALAMPENGKILAIDPNRECYEIGLPIIRKAGVEHKIDFRESKALPILDSFIEDGEHRRAFDFVFVDADKDNYKNYHKRLIELVKVGGVIGYDNTLWNGSVAAPLDTPYKSYILNSRGYLIEFNKMLACDPRVEICQLSVGDGITLCRRIT
ncbi:caffeoyl-CoA O-methyltransferase-like [Andrographis paniculata]|uniref:caffeoyl-CoA O-methyltransferase-like n=1 Tax=Andrographis paniculata TaxID=175694 RepID=UPI0021E98336|nr:caffeoyl-CoA O-methyltransferase-like [Andrographis paniculata]